MPQPTETAAQSALRSPWPWLLTFLLLEPLAISGLSADRPDEIGLTWPRVHIGDEGHYLVMINSLISDGDLDLADNYASVHRGGLAAGRNAAGHDLDHHTKWYAGNRLVAWHDIFVMPHGPWKHDAEGHPVPTLRADASLGDAPPREYSWHPPGLPMLLATVLWPLARTRWVEAAALLCTGLATLGGMLFFRWLVQEYAASNDAAWLATAVTFLCTPAWHYGRTLFCEPYLLALAVAAYALALRASWYGAAGTSIALGFLMKPPFALLAAPLMLHAWLNGQSIMVRMTHLARLALPIIAAIAALEVMNRRMFGGWFRSPIRWESSYFSEGVVGLLVSSQHGLLTFAPAVVVAGAAWPRFLREHRRDAVVLLSACAGWFCLMAAWVAWHGGACYGPRMIMPIMPLYFAALPMIPRCRWWRSRSARTAVAAVCAISLLINAVAAFCPSYVWRMHPIRALAVFFGLG